METKIHGVVRSWNHGKGCGTIVVGINTQFYFHWTSIKYAPEGCDTPLGLEAEFDASDLKTGPLPRAINVRIGCAR